MLQPFSSQCSNFLQFFCKTLFSGSLLQWHKKTTFSTVHFNVWVWPYADTTTCKVGQSGALKQRWPDILLLPTSHHYVKTLDRFSHPDASVIKQYKLMPVSISMVLNRPPHDALTRVRRLAVSLESGWGLQNRTSALHMGPCGLGRTLALP